MNRGAYWANFIALELLSMLAVWVASRGGTVSQITSGIVILGNTILQIRYAVLRLHDTDRSGWNYLWGLIPIAGPIILLVFLLQAGTPGPNRFGDVPVKK